METSRDSCSMIFVMSSVASRTDCDTALTSMVGPSPLAVTVVFAGTRNVSSIARRF